jgi:MFS family permease
MSATPLQRNSATQLQARGTSPQHPRIFYGWWVVLAAAVGLFWGVPVSVYSFSVFLKPLMQEFHASRAAVSLGYTLHSITAGVSAPLVGWLIGRFGSRRIIVPALAMFGLMFVSMKAFSDGIGQFYVCYLVIGLVGGGVGPLPYGNLVSHWFDKRRGLALGLTMVGIGCGAMIIPPFAQHLISRFGWRTAYAIFGFVVLLIPIPAVAAFLKEKPQDLGLLPDGDAQAAIAAPADAAAVGQSAYEAWHSRTFWLLICAFFLVGASVQGCIVHTAALLSDRGISLQTAALGSSLLGAAVMIGRVGTGYLLDRFFAPRVATLFFGCVAAGIGLLLRGGTSPVAFLGAFLIGLGLGAEVDIIPYVIGRYFGLRSFAQIYSVALGVFILAGAFGPLVMGAGYDFTGSYNVPLAALLTSTLVAAVLMTRLGPYRYHSRQANESDQFSRAHVQERPCSFELSAGR